MAALRTLISASLLTLMAPAAEPVRQLTDLRALTENQVQNAQPVHVEGTVVCLEPSAPFHFFLHDGKVGCFVKTRLEGRPAQLKLGDRVRVHGISDPLGYYPSVKHAKVKILGQGTFPEPIQPNAGQLFSPELDTEWVEVPTVITGYEIADERITLAVEVHGLPFKAELPLSPDAQQHAANLMQRPARLCGVMGTIFNHQRQMTDRHFFVPSFDFIRPILPLTDAGSSQLLGISRLLTGGLGPNTPVRVQGIVTQRDAKGFYLRDATGSTLVQAASIHNFPPGTKVEAEGFGAVAPFRPILRASRVKDLGLAETLHPHPFDFHSQDLSLLHAEWVTLDAEFLGRRNGHVDDILQFRSGNEFFEALLPHENLGPQPPLTTGDRLRLTGICELTTTHALPRLDWVDGFRIHLPEHGGLHILSRAPWWNTKRLLIALGIMSAAASLGFLGAWTLRRQVKQQLTIIGGQLRAEAVGEERDRMARELHDTLEQHLSGVALQLDGLDHALHQNPTAASSILTLARRMLRYTRLEAHRSVWDLRSKVLENDGLAAALRAITETTRNTPGPTMEVQVSGHPRSHPPGVDFHLLRIAQEAVTNSIKHAHAQSITISLDYLPDQTRLTIHDDGHGFDPAAQPAPGPHFGLLGMRERAAKITADLTLVSLPGHGCRVILTLPESLSPKPT